MLCSVVLVSFWEGGLRCAHVRSAALLSLPSGHLLQVYLNGLATLSDRNEATS